jgi:hypothetical protein
MFAPSAVKHPINAEDHLEALIDEALEETFPASDPPAPAVDTTVKVKEVPDPEGRRLN